jgi:uncharacterized protein YndB with AHSA1/START domain
MYGVGTTIDVKALEPHKRILVEWDGPEDPNPVEWTFEAKGEQRTFVKVRNWGFSGNADEVVAKALDSTGGFHLVTFGAKALAARRQGAVGRAVAPGRNAL